MITDSRVRPPGPVSQPPRGDSYDDPVFGTRVTRLADAIDSDLYGRCGYWNADGSRMWHHAPDGNVILDTATGAVTCTDVPGNFDGTFSPTDPTAWYFQEGPSLKRFDIVTRALTTLQTFPGTLQPLGGSVDRIDRTGRYIVVAWGGQARVYDLRDKALLTGTVAAKAGSGWIGISPAGTYLVTSVGAAIANVGQPTRSHKIDLIAKRVASTGTMFWSLCGGHGALVSASDGKTYFVTFECHSDPGVWAVNVALAQTTTAAGLLKQRRDNRKILPLDWNDNDGHIAAVWQGPMQDWAFVSVESKDDPFRPIIPSPTDMAHDRPYSQEIVMANVLTGEVRRLAHHRSGGDFDAHYRDQPRVSCSWDGSRVAWASNWGTAGVPDLYAATLSGGVVIPPPPPPPPAIKDTDLIPIVVGGEVVVVLKVVK